MISKKMVVPIVVVITLIVGLLAIMVYWVSHEQIGLVKIEKDIDLSKITHLYPSNPGCSIVDPEGKPLNLKKSRIIPKGTLITGECFSQNTF